MLAIPRAHNGSAVSQVSDVAGLLDDHDYGGTGPARVYRHLLMLIGLGDGLFIGCLHLLHIFILCFLEAVPEGCFRIFGKCIVLDDVIVQVVAQELGAAVATMAVEDSEERDAPPQRFLVPLRLGTGQVDYYGYTVFVRFPNYAHRSIGSVRLDQPIGLGRALGQL